MGEVIGRRGLDGTMRRRQCAPEGIRPDVEPVCVLVPVHHRQRGPAAGLIGRILNGPLQSVSRLRMLFGSGAFEVPEVAQHRLVRAQLIRALLSQHLADAVRQNAGAVGDGGDDPRHEVVLQLEDGVRAEGALVVLGPEMSAGDGVHELHGEAQLRSRLPQVAFHHVARAQFPARGADVDRLIHVTRRRAARDHPEVGEARQAGDDVLGKPVGQRREIGVGAAVLEWQHRDPETFLGARGARVGRGRIRRE